jgi:hypothetical protein
MDTVQDPPATGNPTLAPSQEVLTRAALRALVVEREALVAMQAALDSASLRSSETFGVAFASSEATDEACYTIKHAIDAQEEADDNPCDAIEAELRWLTQLSYKWIEAGIEAGIEAAGFLGPLPPTLARVIALHVSTRTAIADACLLDLAEPLRLFEYDPGIIDAMQAAAVVGPTKRIRKAAEVRPPVRLRTPQPLWPPPVLRRMPRRRASRRRAVRLAAETQAGADGPPPSEPAPTRPRDGRRLEGGAR